MCVCVFTRVNDIWRKYYIEYINITYKHAVLKYTHYILTYLRVTSRLSRLITDTNKRNSTANTTSRSIRDAAVVKTQLMTLCYEFFFSMNLHIIGVL